MRPQHQDPIRLYCHVCGSLLDMVRINRKINAGTMRPCAWCAPDAHSKSVALTMESAEQTAKKVKSVRRNGKLA